MPRIGISNGVGVRKIGSGGAIPPYPSVIEDGNTVAWYIADDLGTITKDGSDFVSAWNDKLGSGHDLLQTSGTNQPLWIETDGILLDDVDNFMKTDSFTLIQPEFIYIVFKQVTFISGRYVYEGFTNNTGFVRATDDPGDFFAYAGSFSGGSGTLTLGTFGILRVLFNGVLSKIQMNVTTPVTGNFGSNNMGGFTLGRSTANANIQVKEIIIRNVADAVQDEQDIYDYLANKYSI